MRRRAIVFSLSLALTCGGSAALLMGTWLAEQASQSKTVVVTSPSPVKLSTVVVTKSEMRYGTELTRNSLREARWPEDTLPKGTFRTIEEIFANGKKRIVLNRLAANEPILKWKITGEGQRASLSAMLKNDLKAVTIRVNEVQGVGGLVLPGNRVDILLTRSIDSAKKDSVSANIFTDVLLQNIRVLAVDQTTDDSQDKPALAKTVTVEVDLINAQKLALAATVGSLSLVLREAGSPQVNTLQRVSISDLENDINQQTMNAKNKMIGKTIKNKNGELSQAGTSLTKISVTRVLDRSEYRVISETR